MKLYTGIVENRIDPLSLGRCQVRIVGLHTHDKAQLPTADLPWAYPMQSVTSAAMNGIGYTPIGPVEGTSVVIMFVDTDLQQPVMLGTIGGISTAPGIIENDTNGLPTPTNVEQIKLRTIEGPVTGIKLTFVDKENGSTDLTTNLTANMKVYGFDIPPETTIVSIVSGTEIIISNPVTNYGENIISFGAAATNIEAVTKSLEQGFLVDSSGQPVLSSSGVVKANAAESTPGEAAAIVEPTAVNKAIPTVPPPKSSSDPAKSSAGIKALIAACDKVGLTTKEQKCALLGIAGGECRWIPQLEDYNYSAPRLRQIYKFATEEEITRYSDAKTKGLSRQEFFSWAYGPTKRGKGFLGNLTDDDGGKYFGRGFIQLTGRANYVKYQALANKAGVNIDIVNNPDSLDNDINVSALVAALYIKDRVSKEVSPNAHPGYFLAAKSAVGVNSPDIAAQKQSYYEYFYGLPGTGGEVKDAGAPVAQPPTSGDSTPGPSEESIKTGSANIGFRDPNNKYPLKTYVNEVDTNRLARGVIDGTIVKRKDATRATGIPKAIDNGSWDQPLSTYGSKYPYNKVFESESGHIQEFDDTPGQERIHTYHRAGTYTEVDPNGTQVNYIVGDNFVLMERNGCIHVAGECNITVDGNANILARSDANIEVSQNATIRVGNNLDIGVANDVTMAVGGDYSVKVAGDYKIEAANIYQKSDAIYKVDAASDLTFKAGADLTADVGGQVSLQSAAEINVLGQALSLESSGEMNILAGGTMRMDYAEGQFGNGAGSAQTSDVGELPAVELTPPPAGDPLNPVVPYLIPPERQFEELTLAETPDDYDTPEGRAAAAERTRTEGVAGAPSPESSETSAPSGGVDTKVPVNCQIIYTTSNFNDDYRLSKNFTLGMLIADNKHRLVDQILRETGGQERLFKVQEIVCNLANTAQNILEPALEILPGGIGGWKTQWKINSGYRLRGVTGGESATSDHPKGRAVDIGILLPEKNRKTYEYISKLERVVNYDQLILEYRYPTSCWIHVSYNMNGNRKMAFTMVNDKTFAKSFALIDSVPPKAA